MWGTISPCRSSLYCQTGTIDHGLHDNEDAASFFSFPAPSLLLQEERNRKAIERSLQAPRKKAGRPVMFRSRLQKRKVSKNKELSHGEDLDEIKHLT